MHELTHVQQYDEGRLSASSTDGLEVSSPSDPHELEAESVAHQVAPSLDLAGAPAVEGPEGGEDGGEAAIGEESTVARSSDGEEEGGDASAAFGAALEAAEAETEQQEEEEQALEGESQEASGDAADEGEPSEDGAEVPPDGVGEPSDGPADLPQGPTFTEVPQVEPAPAPQLGGDSPIEVGAQY